MNKAELAVLDLIKKGPETSYSVESKLCIAAGAILKRFVREGLATSEKVACLPGEYGANRNGYKVFYSAVVVKSKKRSLRGWLELLSR